MGANRYPVEESRENDLKPEEYMDGHQWPAAAFEYKFVKKKMIRSGKRRR
jgi:hypothetical protein